MVCHGEEGLANALQSQVGSFEMDAKNGAGNLGQTKIHCFRRTCLDCLLMPMGNNQSDMVVTELVPETAAYTGFNDPSDDSPYHSRNHQLHLAGHSVDRPACTTDGDRYWSHDSRDRRCRLEWNLRTRDDTFQYRVDVRNALRCALGPQRVFSLTLLLNPKLPQQYRIGDLSMIYLALGIAAAWIGYLVGQQARWALWHGLVGAVMVVPIAIVLGFDPALSVIGPICLGAGFLTARVHALVSGSSTAKAIERRSAYPISASKLLAVNRWVGKLTSQFHNLFVRQFSLRSEFHTVCLCSCHTFR